MKGQICLVTGATAGIGEVTARELARLGATVVILARDKAKAEKLRAEIGAADILIADMASSAEVRAAADAFGAKYPRLDMLVNNAGLIAGAERSVTVDGWERTFAVNHLAPFLLTARLFGKLSVAPAARIVNVASDAHKAAALDLDDPQLEKGYTSIRAYANSKLCNILFTQELARRLKDRPNMKTNALHPGVVASNFGRSGGPFVSLFVKLARPFLLTAENGAATTLYLATSEEGGRVSGGYYAKCRPAAVRNAGATDENARRLWEISERVLGEKFL